MLSSTILIIKLDFFDEIDFIISKNCAFNSILL